MQKNIDKRETIIYPGGTRNGVSNKKKFVICIKPKLQ